MRGHHLNKKNKYSIYISIKIHKVIVDDLCFFFIKISISCYDETGNELGKTEDTVDNAGRNGNLKLHLWELNSKDVVLIIQ